MDILQLLTIAFASLSPFFCFEQTLDAKKIEGKENGKDLDSYKNVTMPTDIACLMSCYGDEKCQAVQLQKLQNGKLSCGFLDSVENLGGTKSDVYYWLCRESGSLNRKKDIAQGKKAYMSSTNGENVAGLAVNGDEKYFARSGPQLEAWWYVDLGGDYMITWIRLKTTGSNHITNSDLAIFAENPKTVACDVTKAEKVMDTRHFTYHKDFHINTKGRYVLIKRRKENGVSDIGLKEVWVKGHC